MSRIKHPISNKKKVKLDIEQIIRVSCYIITALARRLDLMKMSCAWCPTGVQTLLT